MPEETNQNDELSAIDTRTSRQRFVVFIVASIIVAMTLVVVSMGLYASSGAAQLDLSRPGYQSVQDKLGRSDTFESFSATGPVNNQTIDQFLNLYDRQVKPVEGTNPFSSEPLSDHALGIDAVPADQAAN